MSWRFAKGEGHLLLFTPLLSRITEALKHKDLFYSKWKISNQLLATKTHLHVRLCRHFRIVFFLQIVLPWPLLRNRSSNLECTKTHSEPVTWGDTTSKRIYPVFFVAQPRTQGMVNSGNEYLLVKISVYRETC